MTADTHSDTTASQLRAAMVATLKEQNWIRSPEVEAAFLAVPREIFAPEASSLEQAYASHQIIRTRFNDRGRATSSVSAPWLQADMIHAAGVRRGSIVLEVGSGGYNAGLLSEIVGPDGHVVTVDIDPWVIDRTRSFIARSGHSGNITVVLGDAEYAADDYGPFDAVIVTVGAWDCPWGRLLAPGGRLVVPLLFSTISRSITFVRGGDALVGQDPTVCGFVPMQGSGARPHLEALLADRAVRLTVEDHPLLDQVALDDALAGTRHEVWTGVTVAWAETFDTLQLWIATVDSYGEIWKDPDRDCALADPATRWYCPALIEADSFAYLTFRKLPPETDRAKPRQEFGVYGHGRHGRDLAQRLASHVTTWDQDWRQHPGPAFTLYPANANLPAPRTGRVFPKRHTQLHMDWGS